MKGVLIFKRCEREILEMENNYVRGWRRSNNAKMIFHSLREDKMFHDEILIQLNN
jgi:hypothetical protein